MSAATSDWQKPVTVDQSEVLLDGTRLLWRAWHRRRPTGIDRVCLAYLERFHRRSRLVLQRKGFTLVLSRPQSDALTALLLSGKPTRASLGAFIVRALASGLSSKPRHGQIYLNVGHTGLDDQALPLWIARHRVRAVHLVHDLIPVSHPEFCRPAEALKHGRRMTNALTSATGIIANSAQTLAELGAFAERAGLPHPPSLVAWISGYSPRRPQPARTMTRPYFVIVGTIEARKNHLSLLRLWEELVKEMGGDAPMLVIIGQRGWEAEEAIARLDHLGSLADHVKEIGNCSDEELASWLAGARALLMPSFAEGFGLPVVEALELGTPVIASDLPIYREIVGDIPTYLCPKNFAGWKMAIKRFMSDDPDRQRQLDAASRFAAPSWSEHFLLVEDWLARL